MPSSLNLIPLAGLFFRDASERTMHIAMELQKNIDLLETAKLARADVSPGRQKSVAK